MRASAGGANTALHGPAVLPSMELKPSYHRGHRTRVLCVDDSSDLTDLMMQIIRAQPDMESVGSLCSAEGIVDKAIGRAAEIILLDLTMPGPAPLGAIRALAERAPWCRVIAFSGYDDPDTRDEALRAGAWELVSKSSDPSGILHAIRRVAGARGYAVGGP